MRSEGRARHEYPGIAEGVDAAVRQRLMLQLLRDLPSQRLFLTHYGVVEDKNSHLDTLEAELLSWAEWMKPFAQMPEQPAGLVDDFKAFVAGRLEAGNADESIRKRYEAANPAFMSVAGLLRYWRKKMAQ